MYGKACLDIREFKGLARLCRLSINGYNPIVLIYILRGMTIVTHEEMTGRCSVIVEHMCWGFGIDGPVIQNDEAGRFSRYAKRGGRIGQGDGDQPTG